MIFAILPVKDPLCAKQRLTALLDPAGREALARMMYEHVLAVLLEARGFDRVVVATSDRVAAAHARRSGALVFEETEQKGHSDSADRAARLAMEMGATSVLLAPIDVPLVTPAEVESLVADVRRGVVIVPSADGTGTNALVRTPPDAIRSRFGPNSFTAHLAEAHARGLEVRLAQPPGLVFDVDTPADITELLARAPECRAAQWMRAQWKSVS